ncbi:Fic family protein [Streptomyces sp. ISL-99]|uniref:Fic family protein n=1 Tax=Streptomyces sp. ISL-99 TaxID=2819193 RepID=UPI001BE881F2|nr:Fic family protein [Streptomyces sp. ISL-99]MBT2526609.1 Fic family protein [Streptomyces sp. ISL-99]
MRTADAGTPDDLLVWQDVRERVDWARACPEVTGPVRAARDGIADHAAASGPARGEERAERLGAAWRQAYADACAGRCLDFERLAGWQRTVLGVPQAAFRTGTAFAKGGRERYGLHGDTERRFAACLAQSREPAVPLPARAARLYLDVAFFHPFDDGNGRAALLALGHLLAAEDIVLGWVAPLTVARYADDPDAAAELAHVTHRLITRPPHRTTAAPGLRTQHHAEDADAAASLYGVIA